jgi:hypothetical protein
MAVIFERSGNSHSQQHTQVHAEPMDPDETIILFDKFKVSDSSLRLAQWAIEDVHSLLLKDVAYSAEDIIGNEMWDDLSKPQRRELALCLMHLAQQPDAKLTYSPHWDRWVHGFMGSRSTASRP